MAAGSCPVCGCGEASPVHATCAALAAGDLDQALSLGLLDARACASCSEACSARLENARATRLAALAARERHRARTLRLQRNRQERAQRRGQLPAAATTDRPDGLPPAAAAALARAKARAAGKQ